MEFSPPRYAKSEDALSIRDLARWCDGWLLNGDIQQHSKRTLGSRREIVDRLLWYLRTHGFDDCDVHALRSYFHYLTHAHEEPDGRFGNPHLRRQLSTQSIHTYHGHLRTLFRWIAAEGAIEKSPMERIPIPIARADQIQPYTVDEVKRLMLAAKRTRNPLRDEALVLFLLDTGARASEAIQLRISDIDIAQRRTRVVGKGDKERMLNYNGRTARALFDYLRSREEDPGACAFAGVRGPMTRSGLLQLVERLGEAANVADAHPHRFRHTFAVEFLRNGGNALTLMAMLGHTSLTMTNKYVAFAQADIAAMHRKHSPVESMLGRGR